MVQTIDFGNLCGLSLQGILELDYVTFIHPRCTDDTIATAAASTLTREEAQHSNERRSISTHRNTTSTATDAVGDSGDIAAEAFITQAGGTDITLWENVDCDQNTGSVEGYKDQHHARDSSNSIPKSEICKSNMKAEGTQKTEDNYQGRESLASLHVGLVPDEGLAEKTETVKAMAMSAFNRMIAYLHYTKNPTLEVRTSTAL